MNLLFLRQIWALVRKNLLILCLRRPLGTFVRAIVFPLAVVLIVAYSKEFLTGDQGYWGISKEYDIRTLKQALTDTAEHGIVGFIDNGMKGDVATVLDALFQQVEEPGWTPKLFSDFPELAEECAVHKNGKSNCLAAVEFLSSPDEGSEYSENGYWNYTIYSVYGGSLDVRRHDNRLQRSVVPLQRAIDEQIIATYPNASDPLPRVQEIGYTYESNVGLRSYGVNMFLAMCAAYFGVIFALGMVQITYHLTSYVAAERQLGMSSLIDTMVPGSSPVRARLLRQISTYVSFVVVYLPSWIALGIIISVVVFPTTSAGIPVAYHIFSGLAFTSFSLFGASFFQRAQLSGAVMVILTLVMAVLPQVIWEQPAGMIIILSLIFPSANYTYFINGLALWELKGERVDLAHRPENPNEDVKSQSLGFYWGLLALQIVLYPILAFFIEHFLFSTASPKRNIFAESSNSDPQSVALSGFSKTYRPSFFRKIFSKGKDVKAVKDLNMIAYHGQILCLLGPNGSGKSTTMNCIAGQSRITSGLISVDSSGGLGYAPQTNVIWPELTVKEHLRIFSTLKCVNSKNEEIIDQLVKSCDLQAKINAQARTLSGGQKRKLQLAMMFAGGSRVCCVDEVSTGLDPISRRNIWEILLAERTRRTIIMTTHFLDEADFLADNIVIMYKGTLKAEGTSATLKNKYGDGYTVTLPKDTDLQLDVPKSAAHEVVRHQRVYRVGTAAEAAEIIAQCEKRGINDFQVSGPTMEELFLKATGDRIVETKTLDDQDDLEENGEPKTAIVTLDGEEQGYQLSDGRPISAFSQWWILLCKRFRILRRRYVPYLIILAFSIVGAGVAPLLIKNFKKPMQCPVDQDPSSIYRYRGDLASSGSYSTYLMGPETSLDNQTLQILVDVYSPEYTVYGGDTDYYYGNMGFHNLTELYGLIEPISEYSNMTRTIERAQRGREGEYLYDYWTTMVDGGLWLGDTPTMMYQLDSPDNAVSLQNMLNTLLSKVPISTGHSSLPSLPRPDAKNFDAVAFIVYFSLILAAYPAFFALYPTNERISNVRSMQYSNGIRPLPLWMSHLAFDGVFILIIAAVTTGLLSNSSPVWSGLGYVFFVLFLYGIVSAILSYIISLFARGAVTAWFMCALGQVVLSMAYFGAMIGVERNYDYDRIGEVGDAVFFGLGIVSPAVSVQRALYIGLGQYTTPCHGHAAGSIPLFGGPILYLILQGIILFALLLWWDTSFVVPSFLSRKPQVPLSDPENSGLDPEASAYELQRITSSSTDLRVAAATKRFKNNLAVDNITFGVQSSEIFALLGPNGAGKSTVISMIRGDIKPSSPSSSIHIANHSILTSPTAARANLGVCPQFDSADVLTVAETLRFYARIRGVADAARNIAVVVEACGLAAYTDVLVQSLSGGTQRKLSLAIALIGNPRVLVLDEPSSALDANAKRKLWATLQKLSKGRAVVLTTHSMEEADALADRIGIMSARMLAIGEREALKRQAGNALHVHLVLASAPQTSEKEIEGVRDWMERTFGGEARVTREVSGGQVRFEVPSERWSVGEVMTVLEGAKQDLGVEFWSVGRATLDEVFENVVRRHGDGGNA